ncbi:MAG TPA: hypothetical protein VGR51_01240, partial [Thermoplasmata archaeon]|nr:hypothetical protein [Thermoplasmata archaeon]
TLTGLTTDTQYYFDVASTRVGRTTRDSNGGIHYAFRTTQKAEILLVVGETSFTAERLAMYRSALAGASWSWNEWDVARQGDPPIATLREYKAVLWQTGLEQYPPFGDSQATLLTAYINGGGRLMTSGHDIGWAACDPGSTYATPSRCNFVRSLLKADFVADPATFSLENGFAADPISGAYTGGVTYIPHRSGGAGDEANPLNAGGITSNVWRTNTFDPTDTDGFRWASTANNGTAGAGCIWCGAPSRVVSYFFEFTGLNFVAGQPNNAQRTDILNKTIVWLLGRSPPVVVVSSPNGGETITTNTLPVSWGRSQPLSAQEIWYSKDSGASWALVTTVLPTANSDNVDISNVALWPNGDRYLIRVVAVDTGTPAFKAQDASDNPFRINRAGGDVEGPLVRPGSLRIAPNPAKDTLTAWFNATLDDTLRGLSNIFRAEFFVQATEPLVGDYGTGAAMTAVDLAFDEATEDVTGSATSTWPLGSTQTVWVHGQDDATPTRNWGPFSNRTFLVIPASTGVPPNPVTNVNGRLVGGTFADVRISWTIPGGPAIDKFQVYFSSTYNAGKTGYALLADNIAPSATSWDHVAGGSGDPNSYFYYVRAVNGGGGADSAEQAAKFTRSLTSAGWNLVSIPLALQDVTITSALQTMNWRTARTYVATDAADPWKAYSTVKPGGDLRTVSTGMALWVDLVAPDDFTVAGRVPASTMTTIVAGWNFVGYASFTVRAANVAFPGALGVNQLEIYSAAPQYYLTRAPLTTNLEPGKGYWVYATTGGSWTVTN